jgi:hypothetical protein
MEYTLKAYDNGKETVMSASEDCSLFLIESDDKKAWVLAGDHGWLDTNDVLFIDIGEDVYGRDLMTFYFLGDQYQSIVVCGNKPS